MKENLTLIQPETISTKQDLVADVLVDVKEAAKFLALSRSKVYGLMEQGELPFAKIGKSRRVPRKALVELARKCLVNG
jgi:excisionase family DNA binding protein